MSRLQILRSLVEDNIENNNCPCVVPSTLEAACISYATNSLFSLPIACSACALDDKEDWFKFKENTWTPD